MIKSIYRIIPLQFRRRAVWVAITIFVRALLNFVGVAMLVPILVLMLDAQSMAENRAFVQLGEWLNVNDYQTLVIVICSIVVGIILIKNLLIMLLYRYERNFVFSTYKHLSRQLYLGYYAQGLSFINHNNSAHLVRNVNVVSLMFATGVLKPLASILGEVLLLVLIFTAVAIYSPVAALLAAVLFVVIALVYYMIVRRRLNDIGVRENEIQRRKSRIVNETFRGFADIEIGGAMPQMLSRFEKAMDEIVDLRQRHASIGMLPQAFIEVGLVAGMAIVVLLSAGGDQNMGLMFGIFAVAAIRLIPAIRNIMSLWSSLRYNRYTIDELLEVNIGDAAAMVERSEERMAFNRAIELRDISFKYDDAEKSTIDNLSLRIAYGERLGIRGASGVGKTTLFNLILGLYKPTSGEIVVDDVVVDDTNVRKWQNSIGYVSQSVFLSDSTLAENIALGVDPDEIDYNRVNEVVELADLRSFVDTLKDGVHSRIGEQGSRISGGQRQRIGIARALYKQCDVLLFDEATSSLDGQTEENINTAIHRLSDANRALTIVVIAHRETSLEYCDRIITLE
ncbi:MAG: ABC transporter ATP-binding protein [Alistipes sp.]|nr:ABC transporter ATP-binding protein [Alistipes sp.]